MALQKYNQTIHSVTKFTPQQIILPSARSPEIIEKTFARLKSKQARDLAFFNKNKKPCELEPNSDAFETTRQRLKHKKRFKKLKLHKSTRALLPQKTIEKFIRTISRSGKFNAIILLQIICLDISRERRY